MSQLLEKQRTARMTGSLDCSDPDSTCLDSKSCIHQVTTTIIGTRFVKFKNIFQSVKTEAPSTTVSSRGGRGGGGGRGSMMHHRHGLPGDTNQVATPPAATPTSHTSTDTTLVFVPKVFHDRAAQVPV